MRLKGKVALVTGGLGGIGREVCLAFAAEGANVVVNYYDNPFGEPEKVIAEIEQSGGEAYAYQCDVGNEADIIGMIDDIAKRWDGVDILVNNAGIYPRKAWNEITSDEWDRVMCVNLRACFLTAKAVYPYMLDKKRGKIINVSSVTFWNGQTDFLHYVSSKGGIIGFTRALAREVGKHGISVNCITPGAVLTAQELLDFPDPAVQTATAEYLAKEQSISRRQLPQDIVGSFVFLASADSDFITGQTLNVDGGWMMH